jgi:hypothetical protein
MNRTEGAIKSLYHRTLLSLRDDLQNQDQGSTTSGRERKKVDQAP